MSEKESKSETLETQGSKLDEPKEPELLKVIADPSEKVKIPKEWLQGRG